MHGQPVFFKEPSTARVYGAVVPVQRTAEGAHSKAQDAPSGQCLGDRTQKRQEMYVQSGRKCTHKQRASEGEGREREAGRPGGR